MSEFENDVKTYGTQAIHKAPNPARWFENDVKTYGTQATKAEVYDLMMFENDVKTYGTQATHMRGVLRKCLRMM